MLTAISGHEQMRDFASTPVPHPIDSLMKRVQIGNMYLKVAIVDRLREIGAEVGKTVVIYETGISLVAAGYDQRDRQRTVQP